MARMKIQADTIGKWNSLIELEASELGRSLEVFDLKVFVLNKKSYISI